MKNSMHMDKERHPFQGNGRTPKPKLARTQGVIDGPAGEGNQISANAVRGKVKGSINGPGVAK